MSASPPWLLLRGLTRDARHWGDFPSLLAAATRLPVHCLDLPGNGVFNAERSPSRVAELTEHVRRQVQVLGLTPPFRLLAVSLGGMLAIDWSERYPRELDRVVLVNTSLPPFGRWYRRLRVSNYPRLLRLLVLAGPAAWERGVLALTSQRHQAPGPAQAALLTQWTHWHCERPVSRANALRQLLAAARFRAPSQAPAVPILLLASRADALVDVRCSRRLAAAWGCRLFEHPSAGHDLPLDAADWLLQQIVAWQP